MTIEELSPWQRICNHPLCPTYQKTSRLAAYVLISTTAWYALYITVGDTVLPPKGRLFQILLASASSLLAGWLVSLTKLPGLIGMIFIGALYQNCGIIDLDGSFLEINKFLRGVALIVILVRAGLGLDASALNRLKLDIFKLGILPWIIETLLVAISVNFFLDMPWGYGLAMGFALSAISPAVTVPCLLRFSAKGYGVKKGIPTLVMAITTLTDVFSIVFFGIIQSFLFTTGTLPNIILQLPVALVGGIGFGLFWGYLCRYCPESHDSFAASFRVLLLFSGGILSVFGSTSLGFSGAGPLASVLAPFIAIQYWTKEGWNPSNNPASFSFKSLWIIFEPILFVITGAQIRLNELDKNVVLIGTGVLVLAVVARIAVTILLAYKSNLNLKEKLYCAVAMATKATVQAALAPVLIGLVEDQAAKEYKYSEQIMMICILSIILTTPPMAIFMEICGPHLLREDSKEVQETNESIEMPSNKEDI